MRSTILTSFSIRLPRAKRAIAAIRLCFLASALMCSTSFALNPNWQIHQYGHRAWKSEDGLLGSVVNALAQDGDGYFWIGTDKGLFRFDGIRLAQWDPPDGSRLPATIFSLLADTDGSLWIGTVDGLLHWDRHRLMRYKQNEGAIVMSLLQDRDGTIWFTSFHFSANSDDVVCKVVDAKVTCFGGKYGLPPSIPLTAFVRESSGTAWLGGSDSVLEWRGGSATTHLVDALRNNRGQGGVQDFVIDSDGSLLVGISKTGRGLGLQRLRNGKWTTVRASGFDGSQHKTLRMFVDRHQAIWIGTLDEGLYRLYQGNIDHFDTRDGLSGNRIMSLYEDSEGSLWVGTSGGLDQFRDMAVQAFSKAAFPKAMEFDNIVAAKDGTLWVGGDSALYTLENGKNTFIPRGGNLKGKQVTTIFEDHTGRIWVGLDDSLNIFDDGKFKPITLVDGGRPGFIVSMAENTEGELWALTTGPPRTLLSIDAKTLRASLAMPTLDASKITGDPRGGLWIGTNNGDILHLSKGTVSSLHLAGESKSRISQLSAKPDGSVLVASEFGLTNLVDNTVHVLDGRNGLPCSYVSNFVFDKAGNLWLYGQCGLIEVSQSDFQRWQKDSSAKIQPRLLDSSDGMQSRRPPFEGAARSGDGRLWFNGMDVLLMVDPEHMHANTIAPPVHIEGIRADFRDHTLADTVNLPPLTRDIEISYTALSFAAPQRIPFRYRLSGFDQDWHDVGARRQAVYMNLRPGTYTFQVVASNNDGVWNSTGDTLIFTIPPKFYQTAWFRVACFAGFLALLWGLYQLRLHQIQRQFSARLEERVGERTRIARELHDTLLQSLHGLMFEFQAARNMLPRRPENAIEILDEAISGTEQAIGESRDAIHDLRQEAVVQGDLAQMLKAAGEELMAVQDNNRITPSFYVIVEGEPQMLSPIIQHEVYSIAREVMRNAFYHAGAHRIEAEIRYDEDQLRVRLRDNGRGIDPKVLEDSSRPGHWGLPGVRERSQKIGARLDFWSETGAGTEVELTVPSAVAYKTAHIGSRLGLFREGKTS